MKGRKKGKIKRNGLEGRTKEIMMEWEKEECRAGRQSEKKKGRKEEGK